MPIKPENKKRYPKNWHEITAKIRARAGDKCEFCNAPNRETIARGNGIDAGTYALMDGKLYSEKTGEHLGWVKGSEYDLKNFVKIVLTVAHLDHTPENCDESNLKALCQKCHLTYDAKHHAFNARRCDETSDLFGEDFIGGHNWD